MAVDLFLQRFRDGDAEDVAIDETTLGLVEQWAAVRDPERDFIGLDVGGAQADLYGMPYAPSSVTGLMVSRMELGAEDAVLQLARSAGMTILVPGGPAVLTDASQAEHLPIELKADTQLASIGSELVAAIQK
jgi:hypothetical protein